MYKVGLMSFDNKTMSQKMILPIQVLAKMRLETFKNSLLFLMHIPQLNRDHIFWSLCLSCDTNHPDQSRSNERTDEHIGEAILRIKGDCRRQPISTTRNTSDYDSSRSAGFGGVAPRSWIERMKENSGNVICIISWYCIIC